MAEQYLKSKVAKGTGWAFLERFIPQIITIGITPFLARILSPKDFGVFALASVCVGFLDLFSDYGFGSAIIQKKDLQEEDTKTAFSFSCVVGLILFLGLFFFSGPIALFLREPQMSLLLKILSVSFLLGPLTGIQSVLLQRKMQFHSLAKARIIGVLGYGIVALIMAVMGFKVLALVCGLLAEQIIRTGAVYYYSRWSYQLGYSKTSFKHMFNYGIYLFWFRVIDYSSMQLDKIVIGKSIGADILGCYSMADNISKKLFTFLCIPLGKVLFPVLATIQEDMQRLQDGLREVYKHMSLFVFPLAFGFFAVARELVYVFLGPQWMNSVPLLRILAIAGGLMGIGGLIGPVFLAKARTDVHFKLGLFNSIVRIIAVLIGSSWGAIGIACGLSVTQLGILLWNPYVMCRTISMSYRTLMVTICQPAMLSIVMAGGIFLIGRFIPQSNYFLNNLVNLLIKTTAGGVIYLVINRLCGVRLEQIVMSLVQSLIKSK